MTVSHTLPVRKKPGTNTNQRQPTFWPLATSRDVPTDEQLPPSPGQTVQLHQQAAPISHPNAVEWNQSCERREFRCQMHKRLVSGENSLKTCVLMMEVVFTRICIFIWHICIHIHSNGNWMKLIYQRYFSMEMPTLTNISWSEDRGTLKIPGTIPEWGCGVLSERHQRDRYNMIYYIYTLGKYTIIYIMAMDHIMFHIDPSLKTIDVIEFW